MEDTIELTDKQSQDLIADFNAMDTDSDGRINKIELKMLLEAVGVKI